MIIGFLSAMSKYNPFFKMMNNHAEGPYRFFTCSLFSIDVSPGTTSFTALCINSCNLVKHVSTLSLCFLLPSDCTTILSDFLTKSEARITECSGVGMLGSKEVKSTRKVAFEFTLQHR